jgi:hypothetical protein
VDQAAGRVRRLCGGEQTYLFSLSQARNLIVNATHLPEPGRQRAAAAEF